MKILLALPFLALFAEEVKLVNVETGSVVVAFSNGKIQFGDLFLELEMKETGIYIPASKTEEFGGKEIVYLGDPLFEKAFAEVYYLDCIANSLYQWQNEEHETDPLQARPENQLPPSSCRCGGEGGVSLPSR